MKNLKIIFMGTATFSQAVLEKLIDEGYNINLLIFLKQLVKK